MEQHEKILQIIYQAMDEVNATLPEGKRMPQATETVLKGEEGSIDSLGLTLLIVSIEKKIEEQMGAVISLIDASTMSDENSPFRSVQHLAVYIGALLRDRMNAAP